MKRLIITSLSLLMFHAPAALAQTWHKPKKLLTIGFNTGIDVPLRQTLLKNTPCGNCYTNGLYLRRYINRHLAIESGIRFSTDHFETPVLRTPSSYVLSRTQPLTTNIPLAVKYYMAPASKKLRPFAGVGCYYSISRGAQTQENVTSYNRSASFVPIYFIQGISYKLNTRIEINETIHFTPNDENHCQQGGIDLGVGYQF